MEIAEQGTFIDASRRSSPSHAGNRCQLCHYLSGALLPKSTVGVSFPQPQNDSYCWGFLTGRPKAFSLFIAHT
jgi:hypothetical protein